MVDVIRLTQYILCEYDWILWVSLAPFSHPFIANRKMYESNHVTSSADERFILP